MTIGEIYLFKSHSFVIQNSTLLLCVMLSLCIRSVSMMTQCFSFGFVSVLCIVVFPGQRSNYFVLHGPQQASADGFWNFFQHCHVPHFIDRLHIHSPVL